MTERIVEDLGRLLEVLAPMVGIPKGPLSPAALQGLGARVREISGGLTRERSLVGEAYLSSAEGLRAYAAYYLPLSYVRARLALGGWRSPRQPARILDLGSGPGPMGLAAVHHLGGRAELTAIDREPAALAFAARLFGGMGLPTPVTLPWEAPEPLPPALEGRRFDLIVAGNLLNELALERSEEQRLQWRVDFVLGVAERLAGQGALLLVEPALRETSRDLLRLRDRLVSRGLSVLAPCLVQGPCPALARERDWCHAGRTFDGPGFLRPLGNAAGLDPSVLSFSYLLLGRESAPVAGEDEYRVVSELMEEKGRKKVWLCGPRGRVLVARQDRHRAEANEAFDRLQRDDRVRIGPLEPKGDGLRLDAVGRVEVFPP